MASCGRGLRRALEIDQLFVEGQRQIMASYPNYDPEVRPYGGFAADAFGRERAARWADPTGGYIHAMHRAEWGGYHYRITGKDANGAVTYEGGWQNNRPMGMHREWRYVENIFEELDAPGEWFHDAETRTLYCKPAEGVSLEKAAIEAVRLRGPRRIPRDAASYRPRGHAARSHLPSRRPDIHGCEGAAPPQRLDHLSGRGDVLRRRGGFALVDGCELTRSAAMPFSSTITTVA